MLCIVKMATRTRPLEAQVDLRLGQIAVRTGRLTDAQLQQALEEQAEGLRRGRKKPRRLGVILSEKGWLTDAEVFAALEEQEAWVLAQDVRRREDGLLGRILVDAGLAEAPRVEECLQMQAAAIDAGTDPPPRLGDLLVEKGHARREDIEQALELQAGVRFACPECARAWDVAELASGDLATCPSCGGTLEARPAVDEPEPAPAPPPTAAVETPLPALMGRYRLLSQVGQGAMGAVYEAYDTQLDRKAAVKVLRSEIRGAADEAEIRRFVHEAQMAARLPKHPGIAEIHEIGVHEGRHFIAMELVEGRTFEAWRKASGRPLRELVRVLRDVAVAVQHAHDHGVLHRDLKPRNVLVTPGGTACVVDFGLALAAEDAAGGICGTAAYMSPEQAEGAADLDGRCDVYALGVMLYEVLSGRTPFEGRSRQELLRKLKTEAVAPPGGFARSRAFTTVDAAIEKICLRALARERKERTATARAFAAELTLWLEAKDRKPAGPAVEPGPRRPRPRWALPAAGGAALLVVLGVAFFPRGYAEVAELRRAKAHAEAGQADAARSVYEGILKRSPGHEKALRGRDLMVRHLLAEAAADVDEAVAGVDRARGAAEAAEAALRGATLATEGRLREAREAARRRLKDAEERLAGAREALRRWTSDVR
jgi:tRNA A-37 threonylcarbamoyl transferase component Bud32